MLHFLHYFLILSILSAVEVVRNSMAARQSDLRLYLDVLPEGYKVCFITFIQH